MLLQQIEAEFYALGGGNKPQLIETGLIRRPRSPNFGVFDELAY